ncbi:MAG: hypothetical protein JRE19_09530 [Deltaproteobacteria bacterium]|nr:hypothetical protein [Deltaproteobacteria bacterium]MBW2686143.1 hypothetical protein [Deltaproteobacteria bacterium]
MRYLFGFLCVCAIGLMSVVGCSERAGETVDREWGTAQRIDSDHEAGAKAQSVAIDPQGNAIAVWGQAHGMEVTGYGVWSNRFTPSRGWGTAERIEASGGGGADVAIDPQGNALAVWRRWSAWADPSDTFWANRFTPSAGWQTEERIEHNDQGGTGGPRVAMDPQGNAIAVWSQWSGTRGNVWSNRFTPSEGWGTAERTEANTEHDAWNPQVAMDPQGNAIAVWATAVTVESEDTIEMTYYRIWSNRFTPTDGWGSPEPVDEHEDNTWNPQIAMNAQGNAIAVWEHNVGRSTHIWSNRFTPSSGWGKPVRIDSPDDGGHQARSPQVALDAQGRALAVWLQGGGIWSNRCTPTGDWGTAERISDDVDSNRPQLAMNSSGDAIAGWHQGDGERNNLWASRFSRSNGWETPELIEEEEGTAYGPQVVMDPQGRAVAVWNQWDGERYRIWANWFR